MPCVNTKTARSSRQRVSDEGQLPLPRSYPALVPRLCSVVRVGSLPCRSTETLVPAGLLLPSCPTSDDPQSLNAAGMLRAVTSLFPGIVLSCLVLSYSPRPPPPLGLLFVSRTVTVSTLWFGTRAAVQCASFLVPYSTLPACPSALPALPALRLDLYADHLGTLYVLCRGILQAAGTVLLESYHRSTWWLPSG